MKILFVDQFSVLGGAQLCLLEIVDAVSKRGWDAQVALPGNGPLVERVRSRGVAVHRIPGGVYRSGSKRWSDFLALPLDVWRQKLVLLDLINRSKCDLMYVNGPRLLPAATLSAHPRVPLMFHAHNRLNQNYTAALAGWSIRHARATVIACSHYVEQPLAPYVRDGNLHFVPNGTPDAGFRARDFGPGRSWRIGLIGRISPEKGQAEFVRAVALLAAELPEARFVICGAPTISGDKYHNQVIAMAPGLPVEFLGWRDDIAAVLAGLDLLAVPSRDEGMPRVILEAFSAGVPVVAFSTGGIPEVITDGETGFLTAAPTAEALAARIREILSNDADSLRRVVANARRIYERSYTVAGYQNHITALMERVVSASRAERETGPPPMRK